MPQRAAELVGQRSLRRPPDSRKNTAEWQQDTPTPSYGVTGTPAAFVNGRSLTGPVLRGLRPVIDELIRGARRSPGSAGRPPPARNVRLAQ